MVKYGTSPGSYLAIRTLNRLVEDEGSNYPLASSTVLNNFYVDYCISGANTETEAAELYFQLNG